ncbi:putative COP9 signalosome subunit 6 [Monocercomonoides exilis]|uniref:putative COP9 signalosome subunit 6 n=1 Tax=Monocercomonoides exilis TaxID=2049356 RepID=UPI00355AC9B7|nr:putative COP9 signalosome subunit 6 [Monocercomonoides exilis]|eukprot:MONOS_5751.1-p1 / transcript=MONOS_5751.1 / gene=MONOS_5751 / organism=Monocercomonoides_exilis_PA203 / gene_product=Mov34 / transcript_product=Mov34 / location=Mono_scaffold00172:19623-20865(+) / protein_length=370 / sequence_SO=supercontig / SO=protein_coding / is_pseudo=false
MDVVIHPLVFLNVSDHFTRVNLNQKDPSSQIIAGCLLGTQIGQRVEIFTSFEAVVEKNEVNSQFLHDRAEQIQTCYPTYALLGWYLIGGTPSKPMIDLQHKFVAVTECQLLCLTFDPQQVEEEKQFSLYEFTDDNFHRITYKSEALEPERVAVDTMDKILPGSDQSAESLFTHHLSSLQNVLSLLRERVVAIKQFLLGASKNSHKKIASSSTKPSIETQQCTYQILRQIDAVVSSTPHALNLPVPAMAKQSSSSSSSSVADESSTLAQAASSTFSNAFLKEFTEAATIISLTRLLPLLEEFEGKMNRFDLFEKERKEVRGSIDLETMERMGLKGRHRQARMAGFGSSMNDDDDFCNEDDLSDLDEKHYMN